MVNMRSPCGSIALQHFYIDDYRAYKDILRLAV